MVRVFAYLLQDKVSIVINLVANVGNSGFYCFRRRKCGFASKLSRAICGSGDVCVSDKWWPSTNVSLGFNIFPSKVILFILLLNFISRAYPVYTVGESGTIYAASQAQYYATNATNPGASTTVGYATTAGHYLVQQTVDADALIASSRNSPQTTNAVSSINLNTFL